MPSRKVTKTKKQVPPQRGEKIRFVKGSHAGEQGWLNAAKPNTDLSVHVIPDVGQEPEDDAEFVTRVKKNSMAPMDDKPPSAVSAEECAIQEDPKVAHHLAMLSEALAEAGIEEVTRELLQLVHVHIELAFDVQKDKGKKAKFSQTAWVAKDKLKSKNNKKRASNNPNDVVTEHG